MPGEVGARAVGPVALEPARVLRTHPRDRVEIGLLALRRAPGGVRHCANSLAPRSHAPAPHRVLTPNVAIQ